MQFHQNNRLAKTTIKCVSVAALILLTSSSSATSHRSGLKTSASGPQTPLDRPTAWKAWPIYVPPRTKYPLM